ncbi:MAG: hypothetical protein WCA49_22500 [Candidatus Sulfotelmatobacter sp.]
MKSKISASVIILLAAASVLTGQTSTPASSRFDNQYLSMTILRGWTLGASAGPTLDVVQGKYLLTINPVFTHASGVEGGRFSEIAVGMRSLDAVMGNVDQPASGAECALYPSKPLRVTKSIALGNLYTDSSKTGNGCMFPSSGKSVWFGSFGVAEAPQSESTIKLSYQTDDVNSLPDKGSAELTQVFAEVVDMLKTLHFKRLTTISRIFPRAAPPGATVTVYGSGFRVEGQAAGIAFSELTVNYMPDPVIAPDGRSLTFQVPTSVETVSCQAGRILIGGFCLPIPPNHINVNDCPLDSAGGSNFCGIPTPPGKSQITLGGGAGMSGDSVPFTVTAPRPRKVEISLMYPVYLVGESYTITVHGSGFTADSNSVRVGTLILSKLPSPDGKTITFRAPEPPADSLIPGGRVYGVSVVNANGASNSISLEYR